MKNLVEILKDCPQGTKLYSPIFGEAVFDHIHHDEIIVYMKNATKRCFNRYGQYICGAKSTTEGECMLFPSRDNRDWNTFAILELKGESEDEKIRKSLIKSYTNQHPSNFPTVYGGFTREQILAWLEKQGKIIDEYEDKLDVCEGCNNFKSCITCIDGDQWGHIIKHTDKVEPMFNFEVGQWIVATGKCVYLITKIDGFHVTLVDTTGDEYVFGVGSLDDAHLWTIKDAKDGDVLAFNDGHGNECIELIKNITDKKIEFWFSLTNGNDYEVFDGITPYTNFASREDATPATKEQRDILMKAMTDAGYEWDTEKKELKKIEQTLTWSEEDERMINSIIKNLDESEWFDIYQADWLRSLKERMKGE